MTINLILRSFMIWLLIAIFAIINGTLREYIFVPVIGADLALPVSGITLSVIILLITYFTSSYLKCIANKTCIFIGIQWLCTTLIFEFMFGYYVAAKSWSDLLQNFNILNGNLFLVALLVTLFAPSLIARIKRC